MKINWGVSMMIVYVLFATMMIIFAIRTSHLKNDLVTENYYNEAVKYQEQIDENANASVATSKVGISYSNTSNSIELNIVGEQKSIAGKLYFYKPDKASDDFEIDFKTDETGHQSIPLKNMAHGYWGVSANYAVSGKNCSEQEKIFVK